MDFDTFQATLTLFGRDAAFHIMMPDGRENGGSLNPALCMNDGQDIAGINCPSANIERSRRYTPYVKDFDVPEWSAYEKRVEGAGWQYLTRTQGGQTLYARFAAREFGGTQIKFQAVKGLLHSRGIPAEVSRCRAADFSGCVIEL